MAIDGYSPMKLVASSHHIMTVMTITTSSPGTVRICAHNPSIIHNHIVVLSIRMSLQRIQAAVVKDHGMVPINHIWWRIVRLCTLMLNESVNTVLVSESSKSTIRTDVDVWPPWPNLTESWWIFATHCEVGDGHKQTQTVPTYRLIVPYLLYQYVHARKQTHTHTSICLCS